MSRFNFRLSPLIAIAASILITKVLMLFITEAFVLYKHFYYKPPPPTEYYHSLDFSHPYLGFRLRPPFNLLFLTLTVVVHSFIKRNKYLKKGTHEIRFYDSGALHFKKPRLGGIKLFYDNILEIGKVYKLTANLYKSDFFLAEDAKVEPIITSNKMSLELKPADKDLLEINAISKTEKLLSDKITPWVWSIKPLQQGKTIIHLTTASIDSNDNVLVDYLKELEVEITDKIPNAIGKFLLKHLQFIISTIASSGIIIYMLKELGFFSHITS